MDIIRNIDAMFHYNNPTYLNSPKYGEVTSLCNPSFSGSSVNFDSKVNIILASIGEFLERERFLPNNLNKKIYKDGLLAGYSVVDKKTVKININSIIADKYNFADSTGLASHTNSKDCLFNAFKEFLERQSFIFNYLSKGSAKQIDFEGEIKFDYVFNKFCNLKFYDISLIEDFHVILGKVIYKDKFYIGLGASNYLDEAITQCIKEIYQMDCCYKFKKANSGKFNVEKHIDYSDIYMKLSIKQIDDAYKYLNGNSNICKYNDFKNESFLFDDVCNQLYKKYKIKPIVIFLKPLRDIDTLKIIKVLDLNWFPNLCPRTYEERIYNFIEDVTGKKLDRRCNFIPFP